MSSFMRQAHFLLWHIEDKISANIGKKFVKGGVGPMDYNLDELDSFLAQQTKKLL